jgi:uncharacterized protein (TIGR02646 family)
MIHLERLPKPDVLAKKEKEWTKKFLASDKPRPDHSKYAHVEIKDALFAMSFGKCFYCERKISHERKEIDHFIEVSDANGRRLAFNWDNLFLACDNCNGKLSNKTIPVDLVLNPCAHSDEEIEAVLDFEDEHIVARNDSELGYKTIQKYKLNAELLDYHRLKRLDDFRKILLKIRNKQIFEHRDKLNSNEIKIIKSFAQKDHAFSLMFRCLFRKNPNLPKEISEN